MSTESASGFIEAEHGLSVFFHSSEVLAYDSTCLAVGQLVTFEVEGRGWPRAVNVCVRKPHHLPTAPEKHPASGQLRYRGFEQAGSMRSYRFEGTASDDNTDTYVVVADLALFTKYRIGIQEGPSICMRLLSTALDLPASATPHAPRCRLTEGDMLAHLASRPVPRVRRGPKRVSHVSHVASHGV